MTAALGVALLALAGHGALRLGGGGWPLRQLGVLGGTALSMLGGVACLALVTTLAGVLGGSVRPLPWVAPPLALLAVVGLVPWRGAGDRARTGPDTPGRVPDGGAARARPGLARLAWAADPVRLGDAAGGLLAAALGGLLAVRTARIPVLSSDEYTMWALRGRVLFATGRLDPRFFLGEPVRYLSMDYPLLLPAVMAWSASWAGGPSAGPAKVTLALLVVSCMAVTAWGLARLAGPVAAVAGVLAIAALPRGLSRFGLQFTADIPLLAFSLSLVVVLLSWAQRRRRMLLAAAVLMAIGAGSTKNEGILYVLSAFAGAASVAGRQAWRPLLVGLGAAVAGWAPWLVFKQVHGLRNAFVNAETLSPSHVLAVLPLADDLLREFVNGSPVPALALGAAVTAAALVALGGGQRRLLLQLAVTLGLSVVGLYAQYLLSVPPGRGVEWLRAHVSSSNDRVLLWPCVLAGVAVPLLAGAALRTVGRRPAAAAGRPVPSPR